LASQVSASGAVKRLSAATSSSMQAPRSRGC
jgi:hypothetical protein